MTVTLDDILNRIDQIPEPPQTALHALTMLENPDVPVEKMAQFLSMDECITSKLLRLSNTASYASTQRVETVKDAVVRLGTETVKSILFLSLLEQSWFEVNPLFMELWKSALFTAFTAKDVGRYLEHPRPDICFTAGLLCDIGQLMMNQAHTDVYANLVRATREHQHNIAEAEHQVYGFSHIQVGYKMAEIWSLPPIYRQVIQYHHHPNTLSGKVSLQDKKLLASVHVANVLSPLFSKQSARLIHSGALEQAQCYQDKRHVLNYLKPRFNGYYQQINDITDAMFGQATITL